MGIKIPKRSTRSLRSDEERLWRNVTAVVKPLDHRLRAVEAMPVPSATDAPQRDFPRHWMRGPSNWEPGDFHQKPRRARGGRPLIDARLDLHGYIQDQAYAALKNFVAREQALGSSTVLVITGVGRSLDAFMGDGSGVLNRQAPLWLATFGLQVADVRQAHPKDGGAGALYVRLKKPRGNGDS